MEGREAGLQAHRQESASSRFETRLDEINSDGIERLVRFDAIEFDQVSMNEGMIKWKVSLDWLVTKPEEEEEKEEG